MSTTAERTLVHWIPALHAERMIYCATQYAGGHLFCDGDVLFLTSDFDAVMEWATHEIVTEYIATGAWTSPLVKAANPPFANILDNAEPGCESITITPWLRNHDDIMSDGDTSGCVMRMFIANGGQLLGVQQQYIDMFDTDDTPIERLTFHQRPDSRRHPVVVRMDGVTIGAIAVMTFTHDQLISKVEMLTGGAA